jgi:hypothetical protein
MWTPFLVAFLFLRLRWESTNLDLAIPLAS